MNGYLRTAVKAAKKAGRIMCRYFHNPETEHKETSNNLVTRADLACQKAIEDIIRRKYPRHSLLGEEGENAADTQEGSIWIFDPLDGTNNYAHGIPQFCSSVAYAEKGAVLAGAVFDPVRHELFTAVKGQGARCNGRLIAPSAAGSLQESVIATGFYYDVGDMMRATLGTLDKLLSRGIHGIRRFGSAALDMCWVAMGRLDAFFEYKLSPWDFAAAMLIVREAGGVCTDCLGNQLALTSGTVAVSNGRFHDSFLGDVRYTPPV
ncbi:MAG: inositol monophosphatase [Spirochaetales bacterium]|nr:MAG: inositol monophosphatase [Spirochaetales bacterium]